VSAAASAQHPADGGAARAPSRLRELLRSRLDPARRASDGNLGQQDALLSKFKRSDVEHVEPLFQLAANVTKR
jgi:hypothetical protein